jgi:hypothetical protein
LGDGLRPFAQAGDRPPARKVREQAVKVGEHEATSVVDVAIATPAFDSRPISPRVVATARANSESVI